MKLIVGLGNPGKEYAHNRHNVGYHSINLLSKTYSINVRQKRCLSEIGTGEILGIKVLLAKPRTFVNNSGKAVSSLLLSYEISISDLIVIYDDLDLPLGKLRLREDGSSGGHNGIKSIIACTGSRNFNRVKIGIGRPDSGRPERAAEEEIVDYVLSDFTPDEEKFIKTAIAKTVEAVESIITSGITTAMNKFN